MKNDGVNTFHLIHNVSLSSNYVEFFTLVYVIKMSTTLLPYVSITQFPVCRFLIVTGP